jgi:hypothetical protein
MSPDTSWSKRRSCMTEADCARPPRWGSSPPGSETLEYDGVRYRPTLKRSPGEANLKRARKQLGEIKHRINAGSFILRRSFPTIDSSRMCSCRRSGAPAIRFSMSHVRRMARRRNVPMFVLQFPP